MKTDNIIGRKKELDILKRLFDSGKSEFLAIYGRRRVGKSFLVDEAFSEEMAFSTVGVYRRPQKDEDSVHYATSYRKLQLKHFYQSLLDYGLDTSYAEPNTWIEAFNLLRILLICSKKRRKLVFLDELPWIAGTQSSELMEELGFFWNSWAARQRNVFIIVCGSATSWMLDNVIRDFGSLYGRLTEKLLLKPFTLGECRQYFSSKGFHISDYEIALCHMCIGGIPYYLDRLRKEWTLTRNIDEFYFRNTTIRQEFEDVYTGLFSSSQRYIDVVKVLSTKFYGMTRDEICMATGIKGGGTFTRVLDNLRECGIVREYSRCGATRKEKVYQLKDFFSMFYLRFVYGQSSGNEWKSFLRSEKYQSWAGYAFEILCSDHITQIQEALRIKSIGQDYCWTGTNADGNGTQVDLVIPSPGERTDYLCEFKFSENKYSITKKYAENLADKLSIFRSSKNHRASHSLLLVMITTMGLSNSMHNGVVNASICLEDLFT